MDNFQKSRAKLLFVHPFFATIIMTTPCKADPGIPTARTDGLSIHYNPTFVSGLTTDEAVFLWLHEAGHIIFNHGGRLQHRDPEVWNWACDFAINRMLVSAGLTIIKGGLYDKQYDGMSEDQIYEKLMQDVKKGGGKGKPDRLGQDVKAPADGSAAGLEKVRRAIQEKIAQAASMARLSGKMTGELEKFVADILNPKVPWQDLLRDYMTRVTKDDESWSRRNRRFADVYMPSRWSQSMGKLGFIGDISGSVTHEEHSKIAAEATSIARTTSPASVHVVLADTENKWERVYEQGEEVTWEPVRGGGTDMRVPLRYMEDCSPDVVVLITDGYTPWPDVAPDYPLIVCCTTDAPVPIGMVVRI